MVKVTSPSFLWNIHLDHIITISLPGMLLGADVMVFAMSGVAIDLDVDDSTSLTVDEMMNILVDEETLGLSDQAKQAFTLWMCSHYLEVQMKPYHHPLLVRRKWPELIRRFCSISQETALIDDPRVTLKRNCFFPKREEVKIRDQKILELLYEEAKQNILDGRYPCEVSDYEMLAGLQARLELGVYDPQIHTPEFFRSRLPDFLPDHVSRCSWASGVIKTKSSPELRILDQYRRIPLSTSRRKLVRKYLEFSWSLPYYGAAFFKGQIEKPNKNSGGMGFGIASMFRYLFTRRDADVLIAINAEGFYIIDPEKCVVLLGLKYSELSWDFAKPLKDTDPDCLPCLFIQFPVMEAGMPVSKIVQIFSKQAVMMDALISAHVEDIRCRAAVYGDDVDGVFDGATDVDDVLIPLSTVSRKEVPNSCLANKFDKLTMATFNEDVFFLSGDIIIVMSTRAVQPPGKKAKRLSKSVKAGLTFPVTRFYHQFRSKLPRFRISDKSSIYMSAVLEYLTAEVLELAGGAAKQLGKRRLTPRTIFLGIAQDAELYEMNKTVTIPEAGVVPKQPHELLLKKYKSAPAKSPIVPVPKPPVRAPVPVASVFSASNTPQPLVKYTGVKHKAKAANKPGKGGKGFGLLYAVLSEKLLLTGQRLTVVQAHIASIAVDAIVHPTDSSYSLAGEIGTALAKIGGTVFAQELKNMEKDHGQIPPNGGVGGFPKQLAAATILKAISDYFKGNRSTSLNQLFFVLYDSQSIGVYISELGKLEA
ncbi:unnamed protein product [Notodromas monacha]|uniref:FERM domain-containing protein 8 n=1 Tax=Notodromas monacha TaxID=399045 RepID=A0A7R9BKN7_9CRUS|nr:unnamed protein product [Notodromas monacha]CAG0917242.1 unnamed protein product [Notodromas monacha]